MNDAPQGLSLPIDKQNSTNSRTSRGSTASFAKVGSVERAGDSKVTKGATPGLTMTEVTHTQTGIISILGKRAAASPNAS